MSERLRHTTSFASRLNCYINDFHTEYLLFLSFFLVILTYSNFLLTKLILLFIYFFLQLPHGPGVSDLQCFVYYRAICRLCHRNPLLDGKYFFHHKKQHYYYYCIIIVFPFILQSEFSDKIANFSRFHAVPPSSHTVETRDLIWEVLRY